MRICDANLRIRFLEIARGLLISIKSEYPEFTKLTVLMLLIFALNYLCETAFSALVIVTKQIPVQIKCSIRIKSSKLEYKSQLMDQSRLRSSTCHLLNGMPFYNFKIIVKLISSIFISFRFFFYRNYYEFIFRTNQICDIISCKVIDFINTPVIPNLFTTTDHLNNF